MTDPELLEIIRDELTKKTEPVFGSELIDGAFVDLGLDGYVSPIFGMEELGMKGLFERLAGRLTQAGFGCRGGGFSKAQMRKAMEWAVLDTDQNKSTMRQARERFAGYIDKVKPAAQGDLS